MSERQKGGSQTSKPKNYRNDAMKLLTDLLTTNVTSANTGIRGELDNSRNKTQNIKVSKSNSLIQRDLSVCYEQFDSKWKKRLHQNLEQQKLKTLEDQSILDEKDEELNVSSSGFPTLLPSIKNLNSKVLNSSLLRLTGVSDGSAQEESECKRNLIYQHQSYKETDLNSNNNSSNVNDKIYDILFLKKNHLSQTLSTNSSSETKRKNQNKKKQDLSIDEFNIGQKLGSGKFGQVYAARHTKSGFICALKKIKKTGVDAQALIQLIRQIKIQGFLDHPNIAKLYNFFSDAEYIFLMMEYCASGDMYSFLKRRKRLNELCVQTMMRQVCKAMQYMHENNIIHRDLKPQNILLNNGMIKICDFGWSISSTVNRETFCGTPLYVSPELLKRNNYNNKIDVWSIGILTHQLLFGRVPFDIFTQGDLIKIVQDEIYFSKKYTVSQYAKSFILNCLQKDPRDRSTVIQLLEHPFLKFDKTICQEHF